MNPLLPAAAGTGVLLISALFTISRSRRKHSCAGNQAYIDALHLLVDNHLDDAAALLKQVIKSDTANIMAYVALGTIFRRQGHPVKAAKVHRGLLLRGDLPDVYLQRILHQLVLDYQAANMLDKAVEMAERLTERSKKNPEFSQLLLSLYESKGEWDKAVMYKQSLNRWQKKDRDRPRLALYKVKSGLSRVARGAEREGRIRFREAIRLDKGCIPAYINWGDSYVREGRIKDAVKVWREFTEKQPRWAHLVFFRMNQALEKLGRTDDMEAIYKKVTDKTSGRPEAALALVAFHEKHGRMDAAARLSQEIVDRHPASIQARARLIKTFSILGQTDEALKEALETLKHVTGAAETFTCSHCGHQQESWLWHCPKCGHWHTTNKNEATDHA